LTILYVFGRFAIKTIPSINFVFIKENIYDYITFLILNLSLIYGRK